MVPAGEGGGAEGGGSRQPRAVAVHATAGRPKTTGALRNSHAGRSPPAPPCISFGMCFAGRRMPRHPPSAAVPCSSVSHAYPAIFESVAVPPIPSPAPPYRPPVAAPTDRDAPTAGPPPRAPPTHNAPGGRAPKGHAPPLGLDPTDPSCHQLRGQRAYPDRPIGGVPRRATGYSILAGCAPWVERGAEAPREKRRANGSWKGGLRVMDAGWRLTV